MMTSRFLARRPARPQWALTNGSVSEASGTASEKPDRRPRERGKASGLESANRHRTASPRNPAGLSGTSRREKGSSDNRRRWREGQARASGNPRPVGRGPQPCRPEQDARCGTACGTPPLHLLPTHGAVSWTLAAVRLRFYDRFSRLSWIVLPGVGACNQPACAPSVSFMHTLSRTKRLGGLERNFK